MNNFRHSEFATTKFSTGDVSFEIDLFAERLIVSERGGERIAVEVKSFRSQSPMNKFHEAVGQYENYLIALEEYAPERQLFLAIPLHLWENSFKKHLSKK